MSGAVAATVVSRRRDGEDNSEGDNTYGETLTETMTAFDTDGDGVLSKAERTLLRKSRGSVRSRLVGMFDINGDGNLDEEEIEVGEVPCRVQVKLVCLMTHRIYIS